MWRIFMVIAVLLVAALAWAAGAPVVTPEEAIEGISDGMLTHKWAVMIGGALSLLVYLARILMPHWSKKEGLKPLLPWIVAVLGVLTWVGHALLTGADPVAAAMSGIESGGVAVLAWDGAVKRIGKLLPFKF